jgi:Asp-tRNA(Asn)/Glu-tRNA(Gln) amidotransferase A subunit family amidase
VTEHRDALQGAYQHYFDQYDIDAMVFPTTPVEALPIDKNLEMVEINGVATPTFPTYIRNTDPSSNAGLPGVSLPALIGSVGPPVGLELDGPAGSDRELLAIAKTIEVILSEQRNPR